jgi:uncharacterized protein (DUF983 family)
MQNAKPVSLFKSGFGFKCPQCGKGNIYSGLLEIREYCQVCNLALREHDAGDGPAFFAMFLGCIIVTTLALVTERLFSPPLWLHAVIWTPVTIIMAVVSLKIIKAYLIAMQYRYRKSDFTHTKQ